MGVGKILTGPDSDSKRSNTSTITAQSSPSSGISSPPSSPNTSNYTKLAYSIEYPRKNLELLQVLGEGNFGQVWKARVIHLRETYYVAVKTNKGKLKNGLAKDNRVDSDVQSRKFS